MEGKKGVDGQQTTCGTRAGESWRHACMLLPADVERLCLLLSLRSRACDSVDRIRVSAINGNPAQPNLGDSYISEKQDWRVSMVFQNSK